MSSVSYCASLVASLKLKCIYEEPSQGPDESFMKSGYSHCHFSCLFCSDQGSSLKHLIPTVGEGHCIWQLDRPGSHAKKLQGKSTFYPYSPTNPNNNHTHMGAFTTHVHGGLLLKTLVANHFESLRGIKGNDTSLETQPSSKTSLFLLTCLLFT